MMRTGPGGATGIGGARPDHAAAAHTLTVPDGTLLLHIGPHKTGTTSLQQAMYLARDAMLAQGVAQPGWAINPVSAVNAVIGRGSRSRGGRVPSIRLWHRLVQDVNRTREPRMVISSETFADARPDAIRTIVADLGSSRLHVVVTLRPLARILPSQWQQQVQNGIIASYDHWLATVLDDRSDRPARTFWYRHRHDHLIKRWAEVVGRQQLTVVVLDDRDRGLLLRRFEQLLGLEEGSLPRPTGAANRSLSLSEAEAIRAFNRAFRERRLSEDLHAKVMTFGAARYMKQRPHDPSEPRIQTPQWALDRVAGITAVMVANIAAFGVRVVGDLTTLNRVQSRTSDDDRRPATAIPPGTAARMSLGLVIVSGLARGPGDHGRGSGPVPDRPGSISSVREPTELGHVPTYVLAAAVAFRVRDALTRRIRALRGRRLRRPGGATPALIARVGGRLRADRTQGPRPVAAGRSVRSSVGGRRRHLPVPLISRAASRAGIMVTGQHGRAAPANSGDPGIPTTHGDTER